MGSAKENRELIVQGLTDAIDKLKGEIPPGSDILAHVWAALAAQCEVKPRKGSRKYGAEIVFKPPAWQQKICTDSETAQQRNPCDYDLLLKRAICELMDHFYIVYKSFDIIFAENDCIADLFSKTKIRKRAIDLNIAEEVDYDSSS